MKTLIKGFVLAIVILLMLSIVAAKFYLIITKDSALSPFVGERLYVDSGSDAARAAERLRGRDSQAAARLDRVASGTSAVWLADQNVGRTRVMVSMTVDNARKQRALPIFVLYNIPRRDCDGQSTGGVSTLAAYKTWVDNVSSALGTGKAIVIVEPDALMHMSCLDENDQLQRFELLRYAVDALGEMGKRSIYVDAGHFGPIPAKEMARRLQLVGIDRARGFALNVANFDETSSEVAYGEAISSLVGAKPFVVDTSRNGKGSQPRESGWCNPKGALLGVPPLTRIDNPRVDALLWIKTPGRSDGACRPGEPPAGTFWPEYAINLASE